MPACAQSTPRDQPPPVINGVELAPLKGLRRPIVVYHTEYPPLADQNQVEGVVEFEFTIAPNGSVTEPRITREEPLNFGFGQAALQAFVRFKFQPDIVGGVPVSTPARYRQSFKQAK